MEVFRQRPRPACCGVPPRLRLACALRPQGRCAYGPRKAFLGTEATEVSRVRPFRDLGERPWSVLRSRRCRTPPFLSHYEPDARLLETKPHRNRADLTGHRAVAQLAPRPGEL